MPLPDGRLEGESTLSRLMQINLPEVTTDGEILDTTVANDFIDQTDTSEQIIIENIETAKVRIRLMQLDPDLDPNRFTLRTNEVGIDIFEPTPTGDISNYSDMRVFYDKENMVFFADSTIGNNRFHMMHSTGTYFTMDEQGNYIVKTTGDSLHVTQGDDFHIIKGSINGITFGDRNYNVSGDDTLSISGAGQYWFGSTRITNIGTNDTLYINKNQYVYVQENSATQIKGYASYETGSFFVVQSKEGIVLNAPRVIIQTNSLEHTSPLNSETIGGLKQISAGAISLSANNNLSFGAGGNFYTSIGGVSEESITGVSFTSLIPKIYAKKITLLVGDYLLDAKLGAITLSAFQAIHLEAGALGTLALDLNITGSINLSNALTQAGLQVSAAGGIDLSNTAGSLTINVAGITQVDGLTMVKLGSGAEPGVKGQSLVTWLLGMTVPTPVGPSGNPVSTAGALTSILSTKVFTE